MDKDFNRLIAAPFTPFDSEGKIHFHRIAPMAEFLKRQHVVGVFVGGTTGEGLSLTLGERRILAERWKEACGNHLELIVHVGHSSVEEARLLAIHAESIGSDAIGALGPCFFPAQTASALAEYCAVIASGAPNTPFYYYHIPSMVRIGCSASEVMKIMIDTIPNFKGVKFTHEDLDDYKRCLVLAGEKYEVFFGRDEKFLDGLRCGAKSALGSTYNFAAPLYLEIARALSCGEVEHAGTLQKLCVDAIDVMIAAGGMAGIKAAMGLAGFDCGGMRLPLKAISSHMSEHLRKSLDALEYFNIIATYASKTINS